MKFKKKKIIINYLQNIGVFRIGIKENKSQGHVLQFHHVIAFHLFKSSDWSMTWWTYLLSPSWTQGPKLQGQTRLPSLFLSFSSPPLLKVLQSNFSRPSIRREVNLKRLQLFFVFCLFVISKKLRNICYHICNQNSYIYYLYVFFYAPRNFLNYSEAWLMKNLFFFKKVKSSS